MFVVKFGKVKADLLRSPQNIFNLDMLEKLYLPKKY